jgi:four helix bundle protein
MERDLKTLRIYLIATQFGDNVWNVVSRWENHAKQTLGRQWVEAADSIGANIAEGYGRFHFGERLKFLYYARGSHYESEHWLERAKIRELINPTQYGDLKHDLDDLLPQLNGYIKRTRDEMLKDDKGRGKQSPTP